jgi:predicted  nucleic acid-binding Zn-ribbon protein
MTDSKNVLNVENWSGNTDELEKQLEATKEKLHFSRMMTERQKVLALEKEIADDRKRVADLRSLAYDTAVRNKPLVEKLKLETARLINESVSLDNESVMLELTLRPKHQEITDLKWQIEADKNSV